MNCLSCNKPLKSGAKFCIHCGANQEELRAKEAGAKAEKDRRERKARDELIKRVKPFAIGIFILAALGFGSYYGYQASLGENIADVKGPALASTDATTKAQDWLKSLSLAYRPQHNCYVIEVQTQNGTQNYCDKLVETLESKNGADTYVYASLSGTLLNDDDTLGGSHADPGIVEFIKFKVRDDKLVPISSSGDIYSGSFGTPGSTRILALGQANQIGWAIEDGWAGMGESLSFFRLFAPIVNTDTGVKEILRIQTIYDTVNACSDEDKNCISKEIETVVRQSKNEDAYYPLKLSTKIKQGTKGNKKSSNQELIITFDKKKNAYQVPATYQDTFK